MPLTYKKTSSDASSKPAPCGMTQEELPDFYHSVVSSRPFYVIHPESAHGFTVCNFVANPQFSPAEILLAHMRDDYSKITNLTPPREQHNPIQISSSTIAVANQGTNIYGSANTFEITIEKIKALLQSTRVYLEESIPPVFYRALCVALRAQTNLDFANFRHISLKSIDATIYPHVSELLQHTQTKLAAYGFKSLEDFTALCELSLAQLLSKIVVTQDAVSFVGNNNLLQACPNMPFLSVSNTPIDFRFAEERERYFQDNKFKDQAAYDALFSRIIDIVHAELIINTKHGIKIPILMPTGCDVLLGELSPPLKKSVRTLYASAYFLLLKHDAYNFEQVFFCPFPIDSNSEMESVFHQFGSPGVVYESEKGPLQLANAATQYDIKTSLSSPLHEATKLGRPIAGDDTKNTLHQCTHFAERSRYINAESFSPYASRYSSQEFLTAHTTITFALAEINSAYSDPTHINTFPPLDINTKTSIFEAARTLLPVTTPITKKAAESTSTLTTMLGSLSIRKSATFTSKFWDDWLEENSKPPTLSTSSTSSATSNPYMHFNQSNRTSRMNGIVPTSDEPIKTALRETIVALNSNLLAQQILIDGVFVKLLTQIEKETKNKAHTETKCIATVKTLLTTTKASNEASLQTNPALLAEIEGAIAVAEQALQENNYNPT